MKKIAVVLFNLGGPDRPDAVKPFLINLFSDPAILRVPAPLRQILARIIAARRAPVAADIYKKIGGRSPILENTEAQARALEKELVDLGSVKCFVCMRYWHPFAHEVVPDVKNFAPEEIVLLPLYPQFSTTTTGSSFSVWRDAARSGGLNVPDKKISGYVDEPGFIQTLAEGARAAYEKAKKYGAPRLLFSAHGLPETIIDAGDPYQIQCEQTAAALRKEIGIPEANSVLCYQSRVGPLKWIGPAADDEIKRAGRDRIPAIVVPIAFTSEHSETLYEIDILFRDLAASAGVPYFDRVAAVGTAPAFIEGLARLVRRAVAS